MKQVTKRALCMALVGVMSISLCACKGGKDSSEVSGDITVNGTPTVYLTQMDEMSKFVRQEEDAVKVYDASELDESTGWVVPVDTSAKRQTIDGWGASLTDSSAINLDLLSDEEVNEVLTNLFDEDEGIGLNILRQPLGCSDFSLSYVSYDDVEGDTALEHFSIDYDKQSIIPYIKQIQGIADDLTVISAVWSAPVWMKTVPEYNTLNGAMLKRDYYQVYADYIVKILKAYEEEGVKIEYLSPQNEPTGQHAIPATYFDSDSYATFVNQYLVPTMEKNGLDTKLICWDFNHSDDAWDFVSKTYNSIDIIAFHAYYLDWELQSEIAQSFPEKKMWLTESSNRQVSPTGVFLGEMKRIASALRNYSSAYILWNIMLDEEGGPAQDMETVISAGLVELDRETGQLSYRGDFYALGHYSKFIRPGAVILDTLDTGEENDDNIQNVVALNENGSLTVVLSNNDTEAQTFKFVINDKVLEYTIPGRAGATITWDANIY